MTKINRSNIDKTIDRAVEQLCGKYLLTEMADEGYVVVFDVKKKVGEVRAPQKKKAKGKEVLVSQIEIGGGNNSSSEKSLAEEAMTKFLCALIRKSEK